MSYIIAGRAVKNEYLALGTLGLTGLIVSMAMGGGKKEAAAPSGAKPTLAQIKETVKIGAGSSEEEQFIKNFIAEAEKESKH